MTQAIEMAPLNPHLKSSTITAVQIPKTSSNWLTRRNIAIIGGGFIAIGTIIGIAYNVFRETFNATENNINQTSLIIYDMHKHIQETDFGQCSTLSMDVFFKLCKINSSSIIDFLDSCQTNVLPPEFTCDFLPFAREAYEKHCDEYALDIAKTPSECQDVANTMQGCKEYIC